MMNKKDRIFHPYHSLFKSPENNTPDGNEKTVYRPRSANTSSEKKLWCANIIYKTDLI